jgi:tetratricopeptide (TPR) repeat protein
MKRMTLKYGWQRTFFGVFLIFIMAILATPGSIGRQIAQTAAPAARMELKSSSEQAKNLFREALYETQNLGGTRARRPISEAVKADPSFALARAYEAFVGPADAKTRETAISEILSEMGSASVPELLYALYLRESAAGRAPAAMPVLRAVAELVPGDPEMVWFYVSASITGKSASEQAELLREYLKRFPAHAAARNLLAYVLYAAGDPAGALRGMQEYQRLAPNHPNAQDSAVDIFLLLRRPSDALPHAQRELEMAPGYAVAALEKLGLIFLMTGDAEKGRIQFARGLELATAATTKFELMHWAAATYAYTGDGKSALRELSNIAAAAQTQNLPAQDRTAHERMAVVEAYLGDPNAVSAHLTAASAGKPPATYYAFRAIASSRIGDLDDARKVTAQFTAMVAATNSFPHTLNALIALQAKDLAAAEKELAAAPSNDLFTKAVQADFLLRKGQNSDGAALRQEVVTSSIKMNGNPPLDFLKLIAKMHADKLVPSR